MRVYYNEIDPYAAEWLRNLIAAGHIAAGDVDERSITEVQADDLAGYEQVHLFAGIGGWSYALRFAGWSGAEPVWTGSCPFQPLSSAGQRQGHADRRHLWPAFYRLVAERRPATVFGEQVAGKDGREWLAGVRTDLEHLGYACGCADLPAAGVGAPHIRQRLWFVAERRVDDPAEPRRSGPVQPGTVMASRNEARLPESERRSGPGGMGNAGDAAQPAVRTLSEGAVATEPGRSPGGVADAEGQQTWWEERRRIQSQPGGGRGLGDADGAQPQGRRERPDQYADQRAPWAAGQFDGLDNAAGIGRLEECADTGGREEGSGPQGREQRPWDDSGFIPCADGKARRVEPGVFPLAHGTTAPVGRLRAYGNAIVPQVAAAFIRAYREVTEAV